MMRERERKAVSCECSEKEAREEDRVRERNRPRHLAANGGYILCTEHRRIYNRYNSDKNLELYC